MTYATGHGGDVSVRCPNSGAPCAARLARRWLGKAVRGVAALGLLGVFAFLSLAAALLFTFVYAICAITIRLINVGQVLICPRRPA